MRASWASAGMRPPRRRTAKPCSAAQTTSVRSSGWASKGLIAPTNSPNAAFRSGGVYSLANFTSIGNTNMAS